jgi:hypothetical protein
MMVPKSIHSLLALPRHRGKAPTSAKIKKTTRLQRSDSKLRIPDKMLLRIE